MKIRNIHSMLATLALVALTLVSCGDDNVLPLPTPTPDFIVTENVTFEGVAEDQAFTITFDSPASWVAEIHQSGDWLAADKLSGESGKTEIVLTPRSDNFGTTSREAEIAIFVDGYEAYVIRVEQKSAATNDLDISGHVDNGVMTLHCNASGTVFSDTIYVKSSKAWKLAATHEGIERLSFETSDAPQNGVEKEIRVIVSAEYAKFEGSSLKEVFYIKTDEGTAVPVTVQAEATTGVYNQARRTMEGEAETLTFQFTDEATSGVYTADLYIESNVRWTISETPAWVESSLDWSKEAPTNVNSKGNISVGRQHVSLRVKASHLNVAGNSGSIEIKDAKGQVLKTVNLIFAGVGKDYTSNDLRFPANDTVGNPWAFEAHSTTVEEGEAFNRKRISMDFMMTCGTDYSSIADAPFHLILVDATGGIAHKKEVHWATLRMGDASLSTTTEAGMSVKQLFIVANERGDSDDKNKITAQEQIRHAFVYIVPRSVSFEDLWKDEHTMKDEYKDALVLMAQKNDPKADYIFSFNEVANGETLTISPAGETKTYTIKDGSYMMGGFTVEMKNSNGEWTPCNYCNVNINDKVTPARISLEFSKNEGTYNPFTKKFTGAPRSMRINYVAFLGDDVPSKVIYTIYAEQDYSKE